MATTFPFTIDLLTARVVYPGDVLVGVRTISLDKGSQYTCPVLFNSGSTTGLNPSISGFTYSIGQPVSGASPFITATNYNGASSSFSFTAASPVLDYIIAGNSSLSVESYFAFSGNGIGYILSPLTTVINNNPSIAPAEEYYPLNNPSGFITGLSFNTGNFITTNQTGGFYSTSNPSGFITGVNTGSFITTGQTGQFYGVANRNSYATSGNLAATGTFLQGEISTLSGSIAAIHPSGVTGISVSGGAPITGLVNISQGENILLTQLGNTVSIAVSSDIGGGSQTPWTDNIDGGGFFLSDVSIIVANELRGDTLNVGYRDSGGINVSSDFTQIIDYNGNAKFPSIQTINGVFTTSTNVTMDNGAIFTDGAGSLTAYGYKAGTSSTYSIDDNGVVYVANSDGAPSASHAGAIYYDTFLNKLCFYDGSNWHTISST